MSFAAPLFLLGLLAAALPLLIHLMGRQQAPRRRFAALEFLRRSDRRLAQRLRLRHWVLLALRIALVAGIALLLAKPYLETESELPALSGQQLSAVVIVDDTLSMRRRLGRVTVMARAVARAQQLVSHRGAGAEIAVLRLARPTGPLAMLSRDARRVRGR